MGTSHSLQVPLHAYHAAGCVVGDAGVGPFLLTVGCSCVCLQVPVDLGPHLKALSRVSLFSLLFSPPNCRLDCLPVCLLSYLLT